MATTRYRLSEAIELFLRARKGQKKAENTIRLDGFSLFALLSFTGDLYVENITSTHVEDFFTHRVDKGDSNNSLNAHLRAFRVFFKWMSVRRYVPVTHNPVADRTMIKRERTHKFLLGRERFRELLEVSSPRDRIICAIGLYLWMRQGEIILIKIGDVDLTRGEIAVTIPKTGEVDYMPISSRLKEELERWLRFYRMDQETTELDRDWWLVPQLTRGDFIGGKDADGKNLRAEPKLRPTVRMNKSLFAVKRSLKAMGLDSYKQGGHTLRRSGARAAYDIMCANGSHESAIRTIMAMLHHDNMSTTEIYLGIDADRAARNNKVRFEDIFDEEGLEAAASNVLELRRGTA